MRILLVTTGRMERAGLGPALSSHFRGTHEFVLSQRDSDGFTSARLPVRGLIEREDSTLRRLVATMASGVTLDRRGDRFDFVVALDDLELTNADQPELVVDALAKAVDAHVERYASHSNSGAAERLVKRLREKVSFHLTVPMTESWFFADPPALTRAGVVAAREIHTDHDRFEEFSTSDVSFLRERGEQYRDHPKRYVEHLCERSGVEDVTYQETRGGVTALRALDFERALEHPMPFLARLLDDLYRMVDEPAPKWLVATDGPCHFGSGGRARRLRNV